MADLSARHSGRERYKVTERLEAGVLARPTKDTPVDGSTRWSTRKLAAELGDNVSHLTVACIWTQHGIKSHRLEGDLASDDPDFEATAGDVTGLYRHPPQHAVVFCVHENAAIQALDHKDSVLSQAQAHGHALHPPVSQAA